MVGVCWVPGAWCLGPPWDAVGEAYGVNTYTTIVLGVS